MKIALKGAAGGLKAAESWIGIFNIDGRSCEMFFCVKSSDDLNIWDL